MVISKFKYLIGKQIIATYHYDGGQNETLVLKLDNGKVVAISSGVSDDDEDYGHTGYLEILESKWEPWYKSGEEE